MPRPVHEQLADTKGPFDCRSEPGQSEVSSHIARPRWRRLLRAAALLLSKTILPTGKDEDVWIYPDAIGGGTEVDFFRLLSSLLEACDLAEEETGTVLIGMYSFLQANDLPMTAQTWRALTVTAMLASVKVVISDSAVVVRAEARLRDAVTHWWPKVNADKALKVFTGRPNFKQGLLTPSRIAECYFTLRDRSLAMENEDESIASAVNSVSQAPDRTRTRVSTGQRRRSGSGGSRHSRGEDVSQGTSFFLSEDAASTSSHRSINRSIAEEDSEEPKAHGGRDEHKSAHTISL